MKVFVCVYGRFDGENPLHGPSSVGVIGVYESNEAAIKAGDDYIGDQLGGVGYGVFEGEISDRKCHWDETYDGDFKEWSTDCDHALPDSVFNPEELEIEYCPKCGRRVVVRHDKTW